MQIKQSIYDMSMKAIDCFIKKNQDKNKTFHPVQPNYTYYLCAVVVLKIN